MSQKQTNQLNTELMKYIAYNSNEIFKFDLAQGALEPKLLHFECREIDYTEMQRANI